MSHLSRGIEQRLRFAPHPAHRLIHSQPTGFKDSAGKQVILDLDGQGTVEISKNIEWVGVEQDGAFQQFATATSSDLSAQTSVLLGPPSPDLPESVALNGTAYGSGWLVSGVAQLDASHEYTRPSSRFPAPFFRSVEGQGQIVLATTCPWTELMNLRIDDSEQLQRANWRVQNMSEATTLDSAFPDNTSLSATVASHLNECAFDVCLPRGHSGIIIERLADHFHGRQRARVLIDGHPVGWWSEPTQDRERRWRWGRFGIGSEVLPVEGTIRIAIDPPAGAPLWSISMYRLFVAGT
ncbi:MAG: hypothetical protein KF812_07090 [Fimbriimonadaceae bacterium]|nr:hypothetical protein [Fimbriimonadaceae bacterium]